ncbi:flagellar biosynthesis regulator FlaF [Sneathiella glossodoripedis]|uniref:flagellar biosynthesis regulator FlaF n=1 Tax=Sneathiella glossodoripedis TaxID=418853 RepID=UPI00046FA753|nr:flagellar biosynthesis regulator FlaF [Sneathiella glossodoripedis]
MYFEAYKKANLSAEQPAQTEYRLFAEITRELEQANHSGATPAARINSLFRNSQLWLTLKADLVSEENGLNTETKAGLISLALWVERFTPSAMKGNVDLEPLISVNKNIMHGLRSAAKQKNDPVHQPQEQVGTQISI